MAASRTVDIAVVTRTYQGLEGNRVHAGTRLAVVKAQGDLKVITQARYQQLLQNRLVRPLGADDAKAAPGATPTYGAARPLDGSKPEDGILTGATVRRNARLRVRQDDNPAPPKAIAAPRGSKTGAEASASSSPGDPAQSTSTSTARGRRGGGTTAR